MKLLAGICVLVAALALVLFITTPSRPEAAPAQSVSATQISQPVQQQAPAEVTAGPVLESSLPDQPQVEPPKPPVGPDEKQQPVVANTKPSVAGPVADKTPADRLARIALSLVGVDPEAEEYWTGAINNPELSPHERQDLIEDLNEDGLSDPAHPGPEDLPLIVSRLELIEGIGWDAMDQVNADAFDEAYKDLRNMFQNVTGRTWR